MTTDERVIPELADANPIPDSAGPTVQDGAEAERILRRVLDEAAAAPPRRPRPRPGLLVPVASLLVVVIVAGLMLRTGDSSTTGSKPSSGLRITLVAEPTAQTPRITAGAMSREIAVIRGRLASLGRGFTVSQAGTNGITVTLPKGRAAQRNRVEGLVSRRAQLRFYDWEANVLTPNGKTAASQLSSQNRAAVSVSEGGAQGAGTPAGGGAPLYEAVTLAAKQPGAPTSRFLSRRGSEYYAFGAPGSAACATAARYEGATTVPAGHCLLAGPVDGSVPGEQLAAQLPPGVTLPEGKVIVVPPGTVVLQAAQLNAARPVFSPISPAARFFVLRDHAALTGAEITNPRAGTDQSGVPDVTFGFTGAGRAAFQRVTRTLAHRGAKASVGGATLNQHFAVALDEQLLTVPQIDFHIYPDGIIGSSGADITGGFTSKSARDLATELRYGALPLAVRVVR